MGRVEQTLQTLTPLHASLHSTHGQGQFIQRQIVSAQQSEPC